MALRQLKKKKPQYYLYNDSLNAAKYFIAQLKEESVIYSNDHVNSAPSLSIFKGNYIQFMPYSMVLVPNLYLTFDFAVVEFMKLYFKI